MSLGLNKIEPIKIIDPMLDINNENKYAIVTGASRVSWKTIVSTSYSNNSCVLSAPPPSPDIVVNRRVRLKVPVTIDFVGNAPKDQALLQIGSYDSPRAYPLSSNMNTLQIDLNNTSVSINMSDTILALLRYHNCEKLEETTMSTTPTLLDQSSNYGDLIGTIRNPMGSYIDSNEGSVCGRGGFPIRSITNNISAGIGFDTTASVEYDFTEDLFLSPMLFGTKVQEAGFVGLQTFQVTCNWNSDLSRFWSHSNDGGTTLTAISVTMGQPSLLCQYKTPSPLQKIPSYKNHPYTEIQRYPTTAGSSWIPNKQDIIPSSNIQLNSIPRMIYIFCRKRNQDLTFTDCDTYFSIEKISINWANNSGLLSNCSKEALYDLSVKNGCNLSWLQWSGETSYLSSGSTLQKINGVGSILGIEFTDIGLSPSEASGLNGTFQLQMDVTVKNIYKEAVTPELYVVVANEGTFTLHNNSATTQIGVISKSDILNAQKQKGINYNDLRYMSGSSFFKDLGKKLTRVVKNAPKAIKTAKQITPYVKDILKIASLMGVGYDEAEEIYKKCGASVVGGKKRGRPKGKKGCRPKGKKGGILIGGRRVTREELENALYE